MKLKKMSVVVLMAAAALFGAQSGTALAYEEKSDLILVPVTQGDIGEGQTSITWGGGQ